MLKTVEIVIILASGGDFIQNATASTESISKSGAYIYVPYTLAVINFAVQFIVFIIVFIAGLIAYGAESWVNPLYFLISVCLVHIILAAFSKREPQLGQIISAKLQLFKKKIPGRLAA